MVSIKRLAHTLTALCLLVGSSSASTDASAVEMLSYYFDNLVTGNLESARMMWAESARERATRFAIDYRGIDIREDALSPIIQDFGVMKNYLQPPVKQMESLPGEQFQRLTYSSIVDGKAVRHNYYAQRIDRWFWLCYPQDYFAREWPVVESKYLRVHVHPSVQQYVSRLVLNEVDRFVEAIADTLRMPKPLLGEIAARKIEWFYCDSDNGVEEITGYRTKGMLDLASNDIISSTFPHYHELVHLLVNIKLRSIPLHTLPLLREGIAVRYGGRWGKSASALADLGEFLYKEKIVEIDSMLAERGYEGSIEADMIYPVAAVFTSFLLEKAGLEAFFKGYLALSGSASELRRLSTEQVKTELAAVGGYKDWASLMAGFDAYLAESNGERAVALPGRVQNGKSLLSGLEYNVVESKDWLGFEFAVADTAIVHGTLFFGPLADAADHRSPLFVEQHAGTAEFEGYRFAVKFDQNEAGLYDYATNQLLAKYIWGITPSDDYFDKNNKRIAIKFKRQLVGKHLPSKGQIKYLPL